MEWHMQKLMTMWSRGYWSTHDSEGLRTATLFVSERFWYHVNKHDNCETLCLDTVAPWTFSGGKYW